MSTSIDQVGTLNELIKWSSFDQPFSHGDTLILKYGNGLKYTLFFQHAIITKLSLTDKKGTQYEANLDDPALEQITDVARNKIYRRGS